MEKRNYVIYDDYNDVETIVKMTEEQAKAVSFVFKECLEDRDMQIELAENYEGREVE